MAQLTNSDGTLSLGGLVDAIRTAEDYGSLSLPMFSKRAIVSSRVFIDQALSNEEIMTPLMLCITNIYAGFIFSALGLNQYIEGSKKIRDLVSVVATESYNNDNSIYLEDKLNDYFLGSKSKLLSKDIKMKLSTPSLAIGDNFHSYFDNEQNPTEIENGNKSDIINPEPKDVTLPSGRILEVKFGNSRSTTGFSVNIFLQLSPMFVPTDVAAQFVAMNFTPSIKQRWLQASAGEISFIKDLIFNLDQRKERMKALKKDKSGALRDMIDRQENALQNAWMKYLFIFPERQNIANTILIFEKTNFEKACSKAGLRFKDYDKRQQFFNKTFSMMICVVDPMYNRVDIAYNGLRTLSQFTFDQLKKQSKTESMDVMTMMKDFAKAQSPRF